MGLREGGTFRAQPGAMRTRKVPPVLVMLASAMCFVVVGCASGDDDGHIAASAQTPRCGNGLVEDGEACDGGSCCDSACELLPRGRMCRSDMGPCDQPERCDGVRAECPADLTAPVGQSCAVDAECGRGACDARGLCVVHAPDLAGVACRFRGGCGQCEGACNGHGACLSAGPPEGGGAAGCFGSGSGSGS